MRISDWSSDVCSSDLAGQAGLQRLHDPPPLAVAAHVVPLRYRMAANVSALQEDRAGAGLVGFVLAHRDHLRRARALGGGRDRKSVGYGKSVSVRVDLGGRRIMNKKIRVITNNAKHTTELTRQ